MFQKLTLLPRLLLIAAVPMIAVAYFAFLDISDTAERRHTSAEVAELTSVATVVGNLIHELQRERGLSAGYTGSQGASFGPELNAQRPLTDKRIAEMNAALDKSAKTIAESPLNEGLTALRGEFGRLPTTRAEITALKLPVPEIAKRFSIKVDHALETLDKLSSIGRSGDASRERNAYLMFLQVKEYAGLERAMGAAGFTAGEFRNPGYRKFATYGARQDDVMRKVREFATKADMERYDAIEQSAPAKRVRELRAAADLSINPGETLKGFPREWWDVSSKRIDALKGLEDFMAHEIITDANEEFARATSELYTAWGVFAAILIAIAASIWLVARSIIRPVRQVIGTMGEMRDGRFDGAVALPEGNTEFGALGDSVRAFREQLQRAEEARAEQERQKEAQTHLIAGSIGAGLKALSKGDLTHRVTTDLEGPLAVLKTDFNAAIVSLEDLIGAAVESVQNIRNGSTEIAHASEDLARRTERNAASLEESTAAIANLNERISETSSAARETLDSTSRAGSVVEEGRSVAGEAAESMRGVSESAKGIDGVIEGLDKIAFQTRVLAMNAAVEAGRAGEAGRGFAVVADLVSALAMRAEEEAKNARDQLTTTQGEIDRAVGAVGKVDHSLDAILESMGRVQSLVERIASANEDQATVISQIAAAMQDMDVATQKNAAMVEQTSAAARNLMTEAGDLSERTDQFETSGAPGAGASAPRPKAATAYQAAA